MLAKLIAFTQRSARQHTSFDELVRPHVPALYRVAYRLAGNRHDAEDLVQDVLLKLFPKFESLENIRELEPWLLRVLHNQFIDFHRKNRRQELHENEEITAFMDTRHLDDLNADSELELSRSDKERSQRVYQALAQLSCEKRSLLVLSMYEEKTLEQLSAIFELPVGTIKSRLHRAKDEIKNLLLVEPYSGVKRELKVRT